MFLEKSKKTNVFNNNCSKNFLFNKNCPKIAFGFKSKRQLSGGTFKVNYFEFMKNTKHFHLYHQTIFLLTRFPSITLSHGMPPEITYHANRCILQFLLFFNVR